MIGRTRLIAYAVLSTLAIAAVTPAAAQPDTAVTANESRSKPTSSSALPDDYRQSVTAHRGLATFAFDDAATDRRHGTHVLRNGSASFRGNAVWHSDGGPVIQAIPVSTKH